MFILADLIPAPPLRAAPRYPDPNLELELEFDDDDDDV